MEGFRTMGLSEEVLMALEAKGFEAPSPIQELTIPLLLNGNKDIIGQAQTGTGKTAAFGIPIIEKFDPKIKAVQALILTPTRELALQVAQEVGSYKGSKRINITTVYGGAPIGKQMSELERGVHIVVGTPGRVIDLINRKKLILDQVKYVVLDEADEMLNMGFLDDVEIILEKCNEDRRMLLFSATMPSRILSLAKRHMREYDLVSVKKTELTNEKIEQSYYEASGRDKFDALCRVLDVEQDFYGIIFCNTKVEVIEIANHLNDKGYSTDALHGDIAQNLREKVVKGFKDNKYGVLVATDVAARGIDISDLTHVINYGMPQDPESYVHRIGRTGRAGKVGKAIAIIDSSEKRKLMFVQKLANAKISKGKLPDAADMVRIKKQRLVDDVETIIETEQYNQYVEVATELLQEGTPEQVVAAMIKKFMKDELNLKSYRVIRELVDNGRGMDSRYGDRNDRGGRTSDRGRRDNDRGGSGNDNKVRLFYALGRLDGMNPRQLLENLRQDSGIESRQIDDIKILDQFSFFTTSPKNADMVIETYKRKSKGGRSLVDRARERN